jgi:hypothetical protein
VAAIRQDSKTSKPKKGRSLERKLRNGATTLFGIKNHPDRRPLSQTASLDDANRVMTIEHGVFKKGENNWKRVDVGSSTRMALNGNSI